MMNLAARCSEPNNYEQQKKLNADRQPYMEQLLGNVTNQPIPTLVTTANQIFWGDERIANGSITLGPDRPGCIASGLGSEDNAFAIDIVVGRMGARPKEVPVHPNFRTDSARAYISQKTNIDQDFGLHKGKVGNAKFKSGIGLKADGVRIMAREGIKLVTGLDNFNSQTGKNQSIVGVDIIAGNFGELLEPMVKGDKLAKGLRKLSDHISALAGTLSQILTMQNGFNGAVATHFHFDPLFGNPCLPSDQAMVAGSKTSIAFLQDSIRSLVNHQTNLSMWKDNYTKVSGDYYINSAWNYVN